MFKISRQARTPLQDIAVIIMQEELTVKTMKADLKRLPSRDFLKRYVRPMLLCTQHVHDCTELSRLTSSCRS
jgi:hypothetical protein